MRIRRGAYVRRNEFSSLSRQQAHRVRIIAARLTGALDGAVLARESAAVMHGIPLVGEIPQQVQVVRLGRDGGRSSGTIRTLRACRGFETEMNDGVPVASVAQTLADLGRGRPLRDVLAGFDAMLRAGRVTKEAVAAAAPKRSRGRPRLCRAIEVADPNAESPGESLSRAVMIEHHLPLPTLQDPVRNERGGLLGRVDFIWPEHGVIGEFDGRVKYGRELAGRSVEEVLLAERRREIDIERVTGMRVVRWLWDDAMRERGLLEILAEVGIRPSY
ncbi:Transcriptional regulator, AbiEi antitoxin, Type IV TA system [Actinomyces ruminicola]|uniref:Transcriptional regulator, AbiEi antitoxin, Type IV TA system n=1 Tax=Actinomyces ruminicola TaxID=332524 RepID=A0A1G9WR49_9ACTO|nr:Transcriptional regulator, AbiEi antitoxin, Type IV TA system [Actinomyces ruminicola]